jgi:predicted enzyme related to lactoylglutathione lyase
LKICGEETVPTAASAEMTHFEICGTGPEKLAQFYRDVFGWQVEQMPGVDYWRVKTDA